MTLERSFEQLTCRLQMVQDEIVALGITIREDRPLTDDVALVDVLTDGLEEVDGWLRECLLAAESARLQTCDDLDLRRAWRYLARCQQHFSLVQRRVTELLSHYRLGALVQLGLDRGGEWQAWSETVATGFDGLQGSLHQTEEALLRCWQDVSDQTGGLSIANTVIGSQLSHSVRGAVERT